MLNNLINSIDEAIDETLMAVCESMVIHLDKYNKLFDHSNNMELLMEYADTFDIYMESKNRQRDKTPRNEISKWMEKNGYWYTGNDPNKKKKCMRMYHFLQQYEFDPSNETILAVVEKGKPSRRIKVDIDLLNKENIDKYDFDDKHINGIKRGTQSTFCHAIKNNEGEMTSEPLLVLSSKNLQNKQAYSQLRHGHETGHYDQSLRKDDPELRKRMIEATYNLESQGKEITKNISEHDRKIREIDADRYGIENAMKRTKNWGKNKETKHLSVYDLDKNMRDMTRNRKGREEYEKFPRDENGMDSSTKYRRDYAKNYVKEYFSEYFVL